MTTQQDFRIARRRLLQWATLIITTGLPRLSRAAEVIAVRLWPAQDYTRITLESEGALQYTQTFYQNPPRLGVDITGITLTSTLRSLVDKLQSDDPNVARIRVGQFSPEIVRLVVDLKHPINAQVFSLAPIASYKNRLVFDLYPVNSPDPLEKLVAQYNREESIGIAPPAKQQTDDMSDPLGDWIATRDQRAPQTALPTKDDDSLTALIAGRDRNAQRIKRPSISSTAQSEAPSLQVSRKTDRLIIVALDPGHGGEDPGAIGPGGTREKDVVLRIARLLAARINSSRVGGNPIRSFLTRDGDYFVPLNTRVQKARRVQADLFISIHADAFVTPQANGSSVFALSHGGASSAAARWLANRENKADLIGGVNVNNHDASVQRTLLDMSTAAQIRDSLMLGRSMLGEIGKINRLHKPRVEQASFAVLKAPDIPSVLVETAFISNPKEENQLRSAAFQARMADTLLRGIQRYFSNNPPIARSRAL